MHGELSYEEFGIIVNAATSHLNAVHTYRRTPSGKAEYRELKRALKKVRRLQKDPAVVGAWP